MVHGGFVTCDAFIQPFLEQVYCCGAPNLPVIFEMFYDLWIPVIRACDLRGFAIVFSGTRGHEFSVAVKKRFFFLQTETV